jgi:hypothetical protein
LARPRLDIRSVRYDRFAGAVAFDTAREQVEVTREALEALCGRPLEEEEAVDFALTELRMLTVLAGRVPADDGKIRITRAMISDLPADRPHAQDGAQDDAHEGPRNGEL